MNVQQFQAKYPPQPPRRSPSNETELRRLSEAEGVFHLGSPPAETDKRMTPTRGEQSISGRHLWVFFEARVPYVLELAPRAAPPLKSGVAKHTNLTGGQAASCGGELWVDPVDDDRLYVNGASGRYGPHTPQQLHDAVSVFEDLGFRVESFGWDDDVDLPARVLR